MLQGLLDDGRFKYEQREYRDGDVEGFHLCMVATDDGAVNATVTAESRGRRIWVNSADDTPNCDFILPSVVRQGQVVVAASTGGASPALARRLREELTDFLAEDYVGLVDLLGSVRSEIRSRQIAVDSETWSRAITPRVRALVAQRRPDEARELLLRELGVSEALEATPGA
jgi:siroheme synthase-like protein